MDQEAGILFIFLVLSIRALSDGVANPANSKMIMSHGTKDTIQNLSSLLNTARYLGLVSGVVLFESFFQSVIFSKSSNIERIAAGAIEYSLPTGVLVQGFHLAFFMGVIMAIIILVLVIVSKEENDYD
jgi:DHA2 family metal-tetracycline-proton antiporter-like MFS transporter